MTKRYRSKLVHVNYSGQNKKGNKIKGETIIKIFHKGIITESDLVIFRELISECEEVENIIILNYRFIR